MNRQEHSTDAVATAWVDAETQRRRDAFARAALTAILTGDPNMPTRIAVRHAWATANAMIAADGRADEPS